MRAKYIIPVLLLALGFNLGIGLAAYQKATIQPAAYLPAIHTQALTPTPAQSSLVTLVSNCDCSFVTAELIPNTTRVILAYIDRSRGNRLFIVEDIGATVKDIPSPLLARLAIGDNEPSFIAPGPKQGFGQPIVVGGMLRIYFTSRDENDPTGPFKLKRITMPVPAP